MELLVSQRFSDVEDVLTASQFRLCTTCMGSASSSPPYLLFLLLLLATDLALFPGLIMPTFSPPAVCPTVLGSPPPSLLAFSPDSFSLDWGLLVLPLPENGGRAGASLAEPEFCCLLGEDFFGLEPFVSLDLELEFLRAEGIEVPLLWAEDFWALDLMFPAAVLWDGGVGAK